MTDDLIRGRSTKRGCEHIEFVQAADGRGPKIYMVEQSSTDWLLLRLGIPTASEFKSIITPGGKVSSTARSYMARLLAERLLNRPLSAPLDTLEHIEEGKRLEPEAVRAFEDQEGFDPGQRRDTLALGFITTADDRWGASLDRAFLGGILEVKCPTPQVHMLYEIDGFGKEYKVQVMGQLLVAMHDGLSINKNGFATCDGLDIRVAIRWSYNPKLPPVKTATLPDWPFIAEMRKLLNEFSDELDEHERRLRASGYVFETAKAVTDAVTEAYGDGSLHDYTITGAGELADPMGAG
jgi:hypothetical protein